MRKKTRNRERGLHVIRVRFMIQVFFLNGSNDFFTFCVETSIHMYHIYPYLSIYVLKKVRSMLSGF